jgi:hypothetical protein
MGVRVSSVFGTRKDADTWSNGILDSFPNSPPQDEDGLYFHSSDDMLYCTESSLVIFCWEKTMLQICLREILQIVVGRFQLTKAVVSEQCRELGD